MLAAVLLGGVLAASEGHPGLRATNVTLAEAQANCNANKDCTTCAQAATWTGAHCRWCALPGDNSCHAEGSVFNKCTAKQEITDPMSCPGSSGKLPHVQMTPDMVASGKKRVLEAFAAYCGTEAVKNWTCKFCTNPGYTVTASTLNSTLDTAGFVAYNQPEKRIVISFRGTAGADIKNWVTNFKFIPMAVPWLADPIESHRGFLEAYQSLRPVLMKGLQDAMAACPDCNITITGHSLGGAQAVLCATDLATQGIVPQVFTFGSPRVGNADFADWFRTNIHLKVGGFRAVHHNDIVPHVPTNNMGFHHIGREVWINEDETNYTLCDDSGEDHLCSWGVQFTSWSVDDHLHYFGVDEGC